MRIFLFLFSFIISFNSHAESPDQASSASINLEPCTLSASYGLRQVDAQCGQFSVPENRANPDSRMIDLRIAV
ncbi:MAG TPA: hypothetical protein VFP95_05340, partial [Gammaproteobacteria bacterium]|nr:hypothetical protein [Gammaproteobacteria bacterium]